jgi:hypothetical protein
MRSLPGFARQGRLLFHGNLSCMLPQRPSALDPDFDPDFKANFSHGGLSGAKAAEHHCQVCPTCSHQLTGHHCKLVCTQCGYYLSCADYY